MLHRSIALAVALGAASLLFLPSAGFADDRAPTAEERAAIEASLRSAGYESWEEIELDDGLWDVDDARKAGSSAEWEVKIDPASYALVSQERDD